MQNAESIRKELKQKYEKGFYVTENTRDEKDVMAGPFGNLTVSNETFIKMSLPMKITRVWGNALWGFSSTDLSITFNVESIRISKELPTVINERNQRITFFEDKKSYEEYLSKKGKSLDKVTAT